MIVHSWLMLTDLKFMELILIKFIITIKMLELLEILKVGLYIMVKKITT